jgi:hypothetical protein
MKLMGSIVDSKVSWEYIFYTFFDFMLLHLQYSLNRKGTV